MARTPGAQGKKFEAWSSALRLAVMREAEDPDNPGTKLERIHIIANKLVELAMMGDVPAIKLIEERLEGKARASVDHSSEDGSMIMPTVIKLVGPRE